MPTAGELSKFAVKYVRSAIVETLDGINPHSHLVVQFLGLYAPVYFEGVEVVRWGVG